MVYPGSHVYSIRSPILLFGIDAGVDILALANAGRFAFEHGSLGVRPILPVNKTVERSVSREHNF